MADQPDCDPGRTQPAISDSNNCTDTDGPRGLLYINDVQALRRAEVVAFHTAGGAGLIDAGLTTLAGDQSRVYTAKEQQLFSDPVGHGRRRRIPVAADIAGFDHQRRWHDHQLPDATAVAVVGGAQLDDVWHTVAAFLRVGDVVRLRWLAGTGTLHLATAGLHRDELRIEVRRGKQLRTFLLDVAVRPQHARTVTTATHP